MNNFNGAQGYKSNNINKTEYGKHIPFWLVLILYSITILLAVLVVFVAITGCSHRDRRQQTECAVTALKPVEEMPKELQAEQLIQAKADVLLEPQILEGSIPEKAVVFSNSYIIPHSNERLIVFDEAVKYSAGELYFAYYEIFARHHVKFDEPVLNKFFNAKNWYEGTLTPFQFMHDDDLLLNDYEIYNKDSIYEAFVFLYQEEE